MLVESRPTFPCLLFASCSHDERLEFTHHLFESIERELLRAVGISERTLQRGRAQNKLLDANASDRTLRLASMAALAKEVLGSQDAAEQWLSKPAIALDQRRPIELLQSSEGAEMVKTLLLRMDYGVYA